MGLAAFQRARREAAEKAANEETDFTGIALEELTYKQASKVAKTLEISGYSKMSKAELIEAIDAVRKGVAE